MAKKLVLLMLIFANLTIASASAGPEISLNPEELTAVPGEEFTVFVQLDPAGKEVYGYQYSLYFDNEILEVVNQRSGAFLSKYGSALTVNNRFDNQKGNLSYGETLLGEKNGVEVKGVTSSITFRVKESSSPGTENVLEIKDVLLSDPGANIIEEVSVKNGLLKVEEASGVLEEESSGSSSGTLASEMSNIMDPHLLSLIESPDNEESYIPIIVTVENGRLSTLVKLIESYGYGISNVHEMPEINALSAEAWPSVILEISEQVYVDSVILGIAEISEGSDSTYTGTGLETSTKNSLNDSGEVDQNNSKDPNSSAEAAESKNKKSPGYGIAFSLVLLLHSYIILKKK